MNERAAPPPTPEKPAVRRQNRGRPQTSGSGGATASSCPRRSKSWRRRRAPLPVALMLTICAFFAAALAWSFVGRLDVHAVAPGKIETASRAKVIQPFDSGKVAAITSLNGQHVKAGEVLLELDPAEAAGRREFGAARCAKLRARGSRPAARRKHRRRRQGSSRPVGRSGDGAAPSARQSTEASPRIRLSYGSDGDACDRLTRSACARARARGRPLRARRLSSPRSTSRSRRRRRPASA